jgi:hypothetical protein
LNSSQNLNLDRHSVVVDVDDSEVDRVAADDGDGVLDRRPEKNNLKLLFQLALTGSICKQFENEGKNTIRLFSKSKMKNPFPDCCR